MISAWEGIVGPPLTTEDSSSSDGTHTVVDLPKPKDPRDYSPIRTCFPGCGLFLGFFFALFASSFAGDTTATSSTLERTIAPVVKAGAKRNKEIPASHVPNPAKPCDKPAAAEALPKLDPIDAADVKLAAALANLRNILEPYHPWRPEDAAVTAATEKVVGPALAADSDKPVKPFDWCVWRLPLDMSPEAVAARDAADVELAAALAALEPNHPRPEDAASVKVVGPALDAAVSDELALDAALAALELNHLKPEDAASVKAIGPTTALAAATVPKPVPVARADPAAPEVLPAKAPEPDAAPAATPAAPAVRIAAAPPPYDKDANSLSNPADLARADKSVAVRAVRAAHAPRRDTASPAVVSALVRASPVAVPTQRHAHCDLCIGQERNRSWNSFLMIFVIVLLAKIAFYPR